MIRKTIPFIIIALITVLFFKDFFFRGLIPLPADDIVGMYHPWRDNIYHNFSNGVPYKNPLITDPVRQQYPWKYLVINDLKSGKLPVWNPYSFSGTPLLANFQSGVFYIFNIIFFLFNFNIAWGLYIFLQYLLGSLFTYLYLKNLKISAASSVLGALVFIFSGFFIAWGWWGNIIHTLLWLPLLLLCIDKIILNANRSENSNLKTPSRYAQGKQNSKPNLKSKILSRKSVFWPFLFIFSLCSSFFAGHLQIFFYVFLVSALYIFLKGMKLKENKHTAILLFAFCFLLFAVITSVQWLPTLHFISQSARNTDQANWQKEGWFLPWQNLLMFFAPDFFGNPATLNFWGVWNYGEFIGYIGILPLVLAIYAMVFRRDKKVLFFGSLFFLSLIFALPTFLAKIPFLLKIPLISTSQPTRLLAVTDFSLAVLSAMGMDYFQKNTRLKQILYIIIPVGLVYLGLYFILKNSLVKNDLWLKNQTVALHNMVFPLIILTAGSIVLVSYSLIKSNRIKFLFLIAYFLFLTFDLFRFSWKFLPFTGKEYVYPMTKTIEYLLDKQKEGRFRVMVVDDRIFPPNFSVMYHIEMVSGYDPLYLKSYGELINKMENRDPNSSFDRIVTPKNYESKIMDDLNVKYLLSLSDMKSAKLKKVLQEGQTRVYENLNFKSIPYFENQYEY